MAGEDHLSPEEVEALLRFVEQFDPIIVGGQSINIWAEIFRGHSHELDKLDPLTSKDLDFYHNLKAEAALAEALRDGKIRLPGPDDFTPEAAVVTGYLGDHKVTVDFMGHILGVEEKSLLKDSVTFSDPENKAVSVRLMHPLDCVRSRLNNVNRLNRFDDHSIKQAKASLIILDCFIDTELGKSGEGGPRRAMKALQAIEGIVTRDHVGQPSDLRFGELLNPKAILEKYVGDERLDARFRDHQLAGIIGRLDARNAT